jgi:hypothetical protein
MIKPVLSEAASESPAMSQAKISAFLSDPSIIEMMATGTTTNQKSGFIFLKI